MIRLFAAIILFFIACQSTAQFRTVNWGLEYRQKLGFLLAHRGVMGHLPQSHALAGELTFFAKPNGRKKWHEACGFPYVGLTFFGGSVGNNEILGRYWGTYAFIEFPVVRSKHYELLWKLGSGAGFTGNVYSEVSAPKNAAMSSHTNALVCMALKNNFVFGRSNVSLSIDMTHFSNAATTMPNLGINVPYVSLGYGYTFHTVPRDSVQIPSTIPYRKWLINTTLIGSWKETFPTGGRKYPVVAISTSLRRFIRPKLGFEIAFDVISKQAIFDYKPTINKTQWDILQMGLFAGYLAPLDKFHFVLGMGVYIKDKYLPEDRLYHRLGMRYYFENGINMNLTLKSHWAKADYAEFGLGYTFNFRKKCGKN